MSILTVAFDKTWLDAFREKGVRVVRTLEMMAGSLRLKEPWFVESSKFDAENQRVDATGEDVNANRQTNPVTTELKAK